MITWHNLSYEGNTQNDNAQDRQKPKQSGAQHNPVMRHLRSQQAQLDDSALIHWDYRVQLRADALEFSDLEETGNK